MAKPTEIVQGKKRAREAEEAIERQRELLGDQEMDQEMTLNEANFNCLLAFKALREKTYSALSADAKDNIDLLKEMARKGNLRAIAMFLDLMEKSLACSD